MNPRKLPALCLLTGLVLASFASLPVHAQGAQVVPGDFSGRLGPLRVQLHLHAAADGTLSGTLDSPDQGANGIACSDFRLEGETLSFSVPAVRGTWSGKIADAGVTLSGTWNQGRPTPLTFTRDATHPSAVDGVWLGPGIRSLRVQITVKSDAMGREQCTFDSVDQDTFGLPCANVAYANPDFSFDVPSVKGRYVGKLSSDGRALSGNFTAGSNTVPLDLTRQERALTPPPPRPVSRSPAIDPVDVARMQSVLDKDFEAALKSGALSAQTSAGVTIGVVQGGVRRVFSYGTAKTDSLFEIGSITKTFTGLILAQMIEQGRVRLDQPVRELLPPGTVARPEGREIALLDLVTQHSGLPRMPDNFSPADPDNPYVDYRAADLYRFVADHGVARPKDATFLYSNLGLGLLGQALSNRAGVSYAQLLAEEITKPLKLKDTVVSLTPGQRSRFITGHTSDHREARAWDLDALAGAGAIRSTADDMLTYLQANLHPENLTSGAFAGRGARTLAKAMALSHELRDEAVPGMHIAFAWLHEDATGTYWHNGGTGGYTAYAFFNPQGDYAGVVLVNTAGGRDGSLADRIGQHIGQRFAGKPAVDL
jgi:CubicO group peptidase (beta-lactamase class C family)